MNERFFLLPDKKRQAILNAGFKIFSKNSYKKAPVAEIAREAGISKALLFHYFRNKKELYFYLWKVAMDTTAMQLAEDKVMETDDFFQMLHRSLHGKCETMRKYPFMGEFSLKAYYEQDKEIAETIRQKWDVLMSDSEQKVLARIDRSVFHENIDSKMMYREIIWAADGYLHMAYMAGVPDPDKIEKDFEELILFWKKAYLK